MNKLWNLVKRIHQDQRGAEGLEKLLIIAAVVLPLLAVLIFFKDWIREWVSGEAKNVQSDSTYSDEPNPF